MACSTANVTFIFYVEQRLHHLRLQFCTSFFMAHMRAAFPVGFILLARITGRLRCDVMQLGTQVSAFIFVILVLCQSVPDYTMSHDITHQYLRGPENLRFHHHFVFFCYGDTHSWCFSTCPRSPPVNSF